MKSSRRSCATWLHEAGVEKSVVGRLLGHAPKSVTAKHYTSADLTRLYRAVCSIDLGVVKNAPTPRPGNGGQDAGCGFAQDSGTYGRLSDGEGAETSD